MKPFCGGQLLDAQQSPFGAALTPYQCLQYALDKPDVMTVLPGIADRQQLRQVLGFLEAQAEQRKKARIILMEAEQDICEMMDDMGDTYAKNDAALRLRAMHLLYESVRETGGTVVVPSSFSEGFGDVLPDVAKEVLRGK